MVQGISSRRRFLTRAAAGGAVAATTGIAGYGLFRAYAPAEVTELAVKLPRLPRALDGRQTLGDLGGAARRTAVACGW